MPEETSPDSVHDGAGCFRLLLGGGRIRDDDRQAGRCGVICRFCFLACGGRRFRRCLGGRGVLGLGCEPPADPEGTSSDLGDPPFDGGAQEREVGGFPVDGYVDEGLVVEHADQV